MKERPILFSAPMVRALLAGTKTQTRRVVKPVGDDDGFVLQDYGDGWWPYRTDDGESAFKNGMETPHSCPYGQPGDLLWVREGWALDDDDNCLIYRADVGRDPDADAWERGRADGVPRYRWRPSIHMPRAASRITLEVTGVRVERLQDISKADAIAEGIEEGIPASGTDVRVWKNYSPNKKDTPWLVCPLNSYFSLWQSINGPGSWDVNPWVWVLEFKRLESAA